MSPGPGPLRVVLAEDNALLRDGLVRLLATEPEVEVVGTAASLEALLAAVDHHSPDVVITDIRMPPGASDEGVRAAAQLRQTHPETGVVVLSQYASAGYALALLAGGSAGRAYLLKDRVGDVDELMAAVRTVAAGGSVIDPKVVEDLVAARDQASAASPLRTLTAREREVLAEMATGKSNAAIAARLVLSERAVEKHINSIFAKLHLTEEPDVNRRVRAVLLWLAHADPDRPPS